MATCGMVAGCRQACWLSIPCCSLCSHNEQQPHNWRTRKQCSAEPAVPAHATRPVPLTPSFLTRPWEVGPGVASAASASSVGSCRKRATHCMAERPPTCSATCCHDSLYFSMPGGGGGGGGGQDMPETQGLYGMGRCVTWQPSSCSTQAAPDPQHVPSCNLCDPTVAAAVSPPTHPLTLQQQQRLLVGPPRVVGHRICCLQPDEVLGAHAGGELALCGR